MADRIGRVLKATYKKETETMAAVRESAKAGKGIDPKHVMTDPEGLKARIVESIMAGISEYADKSLAHGKRKAGIIIKAARRRGLK